MHALFYFPKNSSSVEHSFYAGSRLFGLPQKPSSIFSSQADCFFDSAVPPLPDYRSPAGAGCPDRRPNIAFAFHGLLESQVPLPLQRFWRESTASISIVMILLHEAIRAFLFSHDCVIEAAWMARVASHRA
jgi:hypothetical protein